MGQLVFPEIQVDGNTILEGATFDVSIQHQMAEHSHFTISCPAESIEGSQGFLADKSKDYIGSSVVVKFNDGDNIFVGVITNITINKFDAAAGEIVISGYSPTILLEHGLDCKSYNEKNLKDILKEAIKDYPTDKVKSEIKPVFDKKLLYTVQYRESDFQFIRRLACRHGEWFYFDGQKIIIGSVDSKEKKLQYGSDLHELSFSMQAKPQDHSYVIYDYFKAEDYSKSLKDFSESFSNPYLKTVLDRSNKVYSKVPHSECDYLNNIDDYRGHMDEVTKSNMKSAANVIELTAVSDEVTLNVGNKIKIIGDNFYKPGTEDDYGTYIVTEIFHECNSMGDYENRFTAIPSETKIPLYFDSEQYPIAQIQTATVMDNADPEGLGRVKVQFQWQMASESETPWIRVLAPHAGGGKGFHFIPEFGEEVLVDFEAGNAEKPYVAGSNYNGKADAKAFQNDQNDMKVIQTRSGHYIRFDDKEGAESITIADKNGNIIIFNTKDKGIAISSDKSIFMTTEEFTVNAKTINLFADEITANGDKKVTINSKSSIEESASTIKIDSKTSTSVSSKAKVEVKGAQVDVDGSAMTNVKGGTLNLN